MGFRGTFKGTLKENYDRMMNPRKFLNEMIEPDYLTQFTNSNAWKKAREYNEVELTYDQITDIADHSLKQITDDTEFEDRVEIILQSINDVLNQNDPVDQNMEEGAMHTGEMDESNIGNVTEVAMPNLTENYNRIQILNKKL